MSLAILADIGGTNTRVALADGKVVRKDSIARFPNADYMARGQDIGHILRDYLDQMGLFDRDEKIMLVDIGYSGTGAKAISEQMFIRESRGAPVIPSLWFESAGAAEVAEAFAHFADSDRLVFKQQVGSNAEGQYILARGDDVPRMPEPMFAQPFRPAIASEGELGFIFVDGELSHATQKQAKSGDYRVQSGYGGYDIAFVPTPDDLAAAKRIISFVEPAPLYARIDLVRNPDGQLELMEMELIEPFLYVDKGPNLGAMLHRAIQKRLTDGSSK